MKPNEPTGGKNKELGLPFDKMKKVTVAFDVDGTLIQAMQPDEMMCVANERIRTLLITLASFKNIKIVVWSGSGERYARQIAWNIGIHKYVDKYASKSDHASIYPDIAIDDIQDTAIGKINLIVREK